MVNRSSKIALISDNQSEGDRIAGVLRSIGFHNIKLFLSANEAYEVCVRELFPFFVVVQELPDMTGLTFIQKLRSSGNYGTEAHLLLVNEVTDLLLPILQEFNIKFVLPKPFLDEKIAQKFKRLYLEESNLSPFERDYRAAISAHFAGLEAMARELAVKVLKTYGHQEKVLILLGDIEAAANRVKEARLYYNAALQQNPLSASAAHKIAKTYILEKDFERAAEMFNQQVKLNPLNIEVLVNTGLSNYEIGQLDKAKAALKNAKMLDKGNRNAGEILANVAIKEGDIKAACVALADSHSESELIQILNNAGVKLSQNNDIEAAIDMYLKCLDVVKSSKYAHAIYYNLGLAYSKLSDNRQAIDCYERALRINPKFEKAAQALARLLPARKSA